MAAAMSIWIGYDPREASAFAVARHSTLQRMILPIPIHGLVLSKLRAQGLFTRPMSVRDGRLWDDLSEAPCATEFSNSRFLTPHLAGSGLALFMDCDMLVRSNIDRLFIDCQKDQSKAVWVVKHNHQPKDGSIKMDGQIQTRYSRKNWSSVMMFNVDHQSNRRLTLEMVNSLPGRDLHAFCWLEDHEIGELDTSWNWLVDHSDPEVEPDIVHFTDGIPQMAGYEDCAFSDEWRAELDNWAVGP